MKKLLLLTLSIVFLISCQDNDLILPTDTIDCAEENSACIYSIPIDSAMAALNDYLKSEEPQSRGTIQRKVANIKAIPYPKTRSRAAGDSITCENILYVANFENNQGYAILSADSRINGSVLAVTEQGQINDTIIQCAVSLNNNRKIIYKNYPLTGPGLFTISGRGDTLFMNPNTITAKDFYNEVHNDYRIGSVEVPFTLSTTPTHTLSQDDLRSSIGTSLVTRYAISQIENNPSSNSNIQKPIGFIIDQNGDTIGVTHTTRTTSDWQTVKHVTPLLAHYWRWGQGNPYNALFPTVYNWLSITPWEHRTASAGCVPLAIAKLFAYFQYPSFNNAENESIWEHLPNSYFFDMEYMQWLLYHISQECGSLYFYEGTFTFPWEATAYMKRVQYNNAHSITYNFNDLKNMIDAGKPTMMFGIPGQGITASHCWNVDGYKIKERTYTYRTYNGNLCTSSQTGTERWNMVHCDFGWAGKCNGYYLSNIFCQSDDRVERDWNFGRPETYYHYDDYLKIVIFDAPY